jgi:hypothetical protein
MKNNVEKTIDRFEDFIVELDHLVVKADRDREEIISIDKFEFSGIINKLKTFKRELELLERARIVCDCDEIDYEDYDEEW